MADRSDKTRGIYWRIMWSSDWCSLTPWTMSGEATKYIGKNTDPYQPATKMFTFGPVAFVYVDTRRSY